MTINRRHQAMLLRAYAPAGHPLRDTVIPKERKPRAKPKREEDALQIACCKLLRTLPNTLFFSVPNHVGYGGKNSGARIGYMAKQKSMGLLPGVSDLVVIFLDRSGVSQTCFAELKVGKNTLSDNQANFMVAAQSVGCWTKTVTSLDDLTDLLRKAQHPSFL